MPHMIRISKMHEGVRTALLKFMEARTLDRFTKQTDIKEV